MTPGLASLVRDILRGRKDVLFNVALIVRPRGTSEIHYVATKDKETEVGIHMVCVGSVCEWNCSDDLGNSLCWCHGLKETFGIRVGTPASLVWLGDYEFTIMNNLDLQSVSK